MSLAIYMDVHVPLAITDGLRRRGIDVLTSQEDETTELDDEFLLARASELGRLLFTQDQDFLRIAPHWTRSMRQFVGILFAHQQGASPGRNVERALDTYLLNSCHGLRTWQVQVNRSAVVARFGDSLPGKMISTCFQSPLALR